MFLKRIDSAKRTTAATQAHLRSRIVAGEPDLSPFILWRQANFQISSRRIVLVGFHGFPETIGPASAKVLLGRTSVPIASDRHGFSDSKDQEGMTDVVLEGTCSRHCGSSNTPTEQGRIVAEKIGLRKSPLV